MIEIRRRTALRAGAALCLALILSTCGTKPVPQATATPLDANWWKGAVIYEVYPRSFADSDGDGVGDLNGITAHLDYLQELGVDGIWILSLIHI